MPRRKKRADTELDGYESVPVRQDQHKTRTHISQDAARHGSRQMVDEFTRHLTPRAREALGFTG